MTLTVCAHGAGLETELHITVARASPTRESHRIAEQVRHALFHAQPKLNSATVHVDPCGHSGEDAHDLRQRTMLGHLSNPTRLLDLQSKCTAHPNTGTANTEVSEGGARAPGRSLLPGSKKPPS